MPAPPEPRGIPVRYLQYGEPMYVYIHTNYSDEHGKRIIWETWADLEAERGDGAITFCNADRPMLTVAKNTVLLIERKRFYDIVDSVA